MTKPRIYCQDNCGCRKKGAARRLHQIIASPDFCVVYSSLFRCRGTPSNRFTSCVTMSTATAADESKTITLKPGSGWLLLSKSRRLHAFLTFALTRCEFAVWECVVVVQAAPSSQFVNSRLALCACSCVHHR